MREGWELKTLKDVCIVERGSSPRPIKSFITDDEDGVNWIKIGDTKNVERYIYKTREKITKEGAKKSRFVDVGDFILSNSMSFGRPYIMKTQGYIHDGWFVFRLPENIDAEFFWYLLVSPNVKEQFQGLASGAIVKNISGDLVKKTMLPIPPLKEQKQIVTTLDKAFKQIDQAKANLEKNLNSAKELFQSKLNEVFSQRGEGWVEKRLGDICNIIGGGTPSKSNQSFYDGEILWATVRDMKKDILVDTQLKITEQGLKNSSSNIISKGNVIIATRVGLGKVCLLKFDTAINQDLKGIVVKEKFTILNKFIFWWFKSIAKDIISSGTGLTVQGVKLTYIKSLQFPYISAKEQKSIIELLDNLNEKSENLQIHYQQKLNNLEELKKSILQKAFKGELDYESIIKREEKGK